MRIVLEEVFRDGFDPETGDPIKVKMGEIVIYTEDLTPDFINAMKTDTSNEMKWKEEHKAILRKEGYDV